MEITEIKAKLTMSDVLHYYGLKPDKNNRLSCPFHKDKTPSMQVYYKTQTAYCFSSNCKTHGKSMDVIDFVMYKEGLDRFSPQQAKSEAINKCKAMLHYKAEGKRQPLSASDFLENMFQYFKNAVSNSEPARTYLEERSLDPQKTEVGYNSGQFHHGWIIRSMLTHPIRA